MSAARVVGAGLSGLAAAWCLVRRGVEVEVVDAAPGPGGLIHTHVTPHGLVETAANAFVWTDTVRQWFEALELTPLFALPSSRARYIWRDGRPRRWPWSVLESAGMAARWSRARVTGNQLPRRTESVADWGARVFGGPATSHLIGPALQGIYAASASELSAAVITASRTKGAGRRRMMAAPARGMGQFIERLHDRLLAAGVRFTFGTRLDRLDARLPTIIATDAAGAASLIEDTSPRLASVLRRVELRPLSTITAFYPASPMDLHGFGVLFPRETGIRALGVLFNADVFADRSTVRSETWILGTTMTPKSAVQALADDRRRLTGRADTPIDVRVTSLPQAVPLYSGAIADVAGAVGELPSHVQLAGNYLGRLGVASLLEQAATAA